MEKIDHFLTFLSYTRRLFLQLLDIKNLKYFYLIFKGFLPARGYIFDFKKYGYKSYVSDSTRYLKTVFINYNNRSLFNDKYSSCLFLSQFTNKTVPVYGLIDRGKLYVLRDNTLDDLFHSEKKFVIKPRNGRGGEGVFILEILDDKYYLNGKEVQDLKATWKHFRNHVLVPYVYPHQYSYSIYPHSLNTIRILTGILDDNVLIMRAGHRFGGANTGNVDNFTQGGIFANIDVATGMLENPNVWNGKIRKLIKVDKHPVTNEPITGVEIPFWKTITSDIIKLHSSIKFIRYVGWDIAITPNDYRIIEANYASDLVGLQLTTPLLIDEANKKFFSNL